MMMMMIATLINTEDPPASHLPSALFVQPSAHVSAKPLQSRRTLCDPMDCSLPGSSVHGDSLGQSGLPCSPPGDFPNAGIKPKSPILQVDSLLPEPPWKPLNLDGILKSRDSTLPAKVSYNQSYGFSDSHLRMWEVDHKEGSKESLELQGDQTNQSLRKLILNIHWKDWC